MALAEELRSAVGSLTAFGRSDARARPQTLAGALAFYPAVGLLLGLVASGVAWAVDQGYPAFAGAAGVLVLAALSGGRAARSLAAGGALGVSTAGLAFAARLWSVTGLPAPALTATLLVAPMLGRWAIVVQCYGGVPAAASAPAALAGRARFREFGIASVTAFAVTLAVADAAGLLVLVAAALATVALRVYAYRGAGRMTERLLAAAAELVETVVMVAFALLASPHEPGAALARGPS